MVRVFDHRCLPFGQCCLASASQVKRKRQVLAGHKKKENKKKKQKNSTVANPTLISSIVLD